MNDAGAVFGGDVTVDEHLEGLFGALFDHGRLEGEQGHVAGVLKLHFALHGLYDFVPVFPSLAEHGRSQRQGKGSSTSPLSRFWKYA